MPKSSYTGPKLPTALLNKIDGPRSSKKHSQRIITRKDQRKAERQDRKASRVVPRSARPAIHNVEAEEDATRSKPHNARGADSRQPAKSLPRSILKRPASQQQPTPETESESESTAAQQSEKPTISRAVKRKLEEDDAEIAALEKKLGIRGKKSKVLEEDGLDWLAHGSDHEDDDAIGGSGTTEYQAWLQSKRRMATQMDTDEDSEPDDDEEDGLDVNDAMDSDMEGLQNPFSDDELDSDDFDGFEQERDISVPIRKTKRENPYIAPVSTPSAGKYIPPSLRRISEGEDLTQLRRQIQGQFNRLSEANFISILSAVERIYTENARQHVTMTLIDLFTGLVTTESTLSEPFLILHAAFATAIYKVVGTDFGAQLLEKLTKAITSYAQSPAKQVLNLLGFLSNLYIMQMVGSPIVYDYIKGLLEEMSEENTELLLRIVRTAGVQLRQDDPTSLKDIVVLLTRSAAQVGDSKLSVRTRFMIETINDLKNNKMKSGSNLAVEHVVRMKKTLGTLNTRALRASEPLQVSLADLQNSDKKGKWWLVGASYNDPAKREDMGSNAKTSDRTDDGYESETPGHVSLTKLAKAQGMNTDVRRAIFNAIMSASDVQDANARIVKLHLKNKQTLEVAKVLLHCAAAETAYNPYYTFIARKLCVDAKMQKALVSALWDILRKLDASKQEEEDMTTGAIINMGRLYGTLISDDLISITTLKTLEFAILASQARAFAEILLTTVMLRARKSKHFEQTIEVVFVQSTSAPRMIQGLQVFLRDVVSRADLTNSKQEREAVRTGCDLAIQVMSTAVSNIVISDNSSSNQDSSDDEY